MNSIKLYKNATRSIKKTKELLHCKRRGGSPVACDAFSHDAVLHQPLLIQKSKAGVGAMQLCIAIKKREAG